MKKISFLFGTLISLLFLSCASTPSTPPPSFTSDIQSEKNSELATISVTTQWQNAFLFTSAGISGFNVAIKNNTDKIIRVVWEKSSLSYAGQSFTPFITGQKYTNASEPMAATVVPSKGALEKDVFSSEQPYYESGQYGGWRMNPIIANSVIIVLCIQSGDIEDYYTITVNRE
jgi:hypothetical protein